MPRRLHSPCSLFFLLLLTGFPAGTAGPADTVPLGAERSTTAGAPAINRVFDYSFKVQSIDGHIMNFDKFKNKVVFLNLWATWCGPCRYEMYSIQRLFEETGQDVAFVMLSIDDPGAVNRVKKYIDSNNFTFPVYMPSGELTEQLKVRIIPTTFIISPNGQIAFYHEGERNYNSRKIKSLLDEVTEWK